MGLSVIEARTLDQMPSAPMSTSPCTSAPPSSTAVMLPSALSRSATHGRRGGENESGEGATGGDEGEGKSEGTGEGEGEGRGRVKDRLTGAVRGGEGR